MSIKPFVHDLFQLPVLNEARIKENAHKKPVFFESLGLALQDLHLLELFNTDSQPPFDQSKFEYLIMAILQ